MDSGVTTDRVRAGRGRTGGAGPVTPWKSPGVRYTPAEWEARRRGLVTGKNQARAARQRTEDEARRMWEAGRIIPARITAALDLHGLEGPQVDIDCGAMEPDVDHWELGILYPTWEQFVKLATLTDLPLAFFWKESAPLTGGFLCGPRKCTPVVDGDRVLAFTQDALDARLRDKVDAGGRLW
jgi:hypothetical protein